MARTLPFLVLLAHILVPSPAHAAKPACIGTLQTDITAARGEMIDLLQHPEGKSVEYATRMRQSLYGFLGTAPKDGGLADGVAARGKDRWLDNACMDDNSGYKPWMEKTLSGAVGPVLDDGLKVFRMNCAKAAEVNASASSAFWDDCGVRPLSAATDNAVAGSALAACEARVDKKVSSARVQLELSGSVERMEGIVSRLQRDLGPASKEAQECGASAAAAFAAFQTQAQEQVDDKNADAHAECVAGLRRDIKATRDKAQAKAQDPPKITVGGKSTPLDETMRRGLVSLQEELADPRTRAHRAYQRCGSDVDAELARLEVEVDAFIVAAKARQAEQAVSHCGRVAELHFRILRGTENKDLSDFPSGLTTGWNHHPQEVEQLGTVCVDAIDATSPNRQADFGQLSPAQRRQVGVPEHVSYDAVYALAMEMQTDAAGWIADAISQRASVLEQVKAEWIAAHVKGPDMLKVYRERGEPSSINTTGGRISWVYGYVNDNLTYNTCDAYVFSTGGTLQQRRDSYACAK